MKFNKNHIITFNGLWLKDDLDTLIENIEYVTKILNELQIIVMPVN